MGLPKAKKTHQTNQEEQGSKVFGLSQYKLPVYENSGY
jgi:hypothetical protein